MSDLEEPKPGVSRRTVAKAMAWSVPAIALAVPAPAFAASQGIVQLTGTGCKLPGNSQDLYKGYAFKASAVNTTAAPVTVTFVSAHPQRAWTLGQPSSSRISTGCTVGYVVHGTREHDVPEPGDRHSERQQQLQRNAGRELHRRRRRRHAAGDRRRDRPQPDPGRELRRVHAGQNVCITSFGA